MPSIYIPRGPHYSAPRGNRYHEYSSSSSKTKQDSTMTYKTPTEYGPVGTNVDVIKHFMRKRFFIANYDIPNDIDFVRHLSQQTANITETDKGIAIQIWMDGYVSELYYLTPKAYQYYNEILEKLK